VTEDERGRYLIIPVALAGLITMWLAAVVLIWFGTFGAVDGAEYWGLLCSAAAAAWTVIYGLARQHKTLEYAFQVGRETGERSVRAVQ
jgi:hypothetical protein